MKTASWPDPAGPGGNPKWCGCTEFTNTTINPNRETGWSGKLSVLAKNLHVVIPVTCTACQWKGKHCLFRFLCKGPGEWMCSLIIHSQTIRERGVVSYQILSLCEIGGYTLLQGRASPHLFSTSVFWGGWFFSFPFISWRTVWRNCPSVPQGRTDGWQGSLVTVCIVSPNSSHKGPNVPGFGPIMWCFLQAADDWHLCWQV